MGSSHQAFIAVSVGNTSLQLARYGTEATPEAPVHLSQLRLPVLQPDFEVLQHWLGAETHPWYVASVNRTAEEPIRTWLRDTRPSTPYQLLSNRDFPLILDVEQPERVGTDRVANGVAVRRAKPPHEAAIIVDSGTAITVDGLSADGRFLGGAILPGVRLSARALQLGTDQLPQVELDVADERPSPIGRSTHAAIASGLHWGSVGAVRQLVQGLAETMGCPAGGACPLFITGGDGQRLLPHLGPSAQWVPDLVLQGIATTAMVVMGLEAKSPSAGHES